MYSIKIIYRLLLYISFFEKAAAQLQINPRDDYYTHIFTLLLISDSFR